MFEYELGNDGYSILRCNFVDDIDVFCSMGFLFVGDLCLNLKEISMFFLAKEESSIFFNRNTSKEHVNGKIFRVEIRFKTAEYAENVYRRIVKTMTNPIFMINPGSRNFNPNDPQYEIKLL